LLGWEARYEPKAVAYHYRGWGIQKKRRDIPLLIRRHSFINKYLMMIKNESMINVLKHLPFILVYEILAFSYIIIKEKELLTNWAQCKKLFQEARRKRS